ncbi:Thymidylate kinase [Candidatus Trichorickettsia mobilis]|uniref:Thymidylate kinase n=1 Tax=Candidatus Trichorickettsia mobilis TaxID=1346319 RepID=A0ABZ0UQM2_9RICK|nr:dTMP kinase [Candidatus Trichorickettsia mobilis]WPY00350.1 Thymidylate kinase [Candidatus Trichorickettsia mobilis]
MIDYNNPKFVTFEGVVGCGKTTQSKMLHEHLLSKGLEARRTREIGGTRVAELIRDIVIYEHMLPYSELLLIMAARYEHIHKIIIPALTLNQWVICDRFVDSTACYQGLSDIGSDKVYQLHDEIFNNLMPDITFFIDVPPTEALDRISNNLDCNKFENEGLEFHNKIYQGFQAITKQFSNRIVRIEAAQLNPEQVHMKILQALS